MYNNIHQGYQCPYCTNAPMNNLYNMYPCTYLYNIPAYNPYFENQFSNQYPTLTGKTKNDVSIELKDYGPEPFVIDIEKATIQNNNFRTALWTGKYLQLTLMSINVGEDIGLEIHPDLDQFIRIEEGQGLVKMGDSKENLDFQANVHSDFSFIIPAGKWHNLINTGNTPLKLYSIYAPPQHPHGTVHVTKEDAQAAE